MRFPWPEGGWMAWIAQERSRRVGAFAGGDGGLRLGLGCREVGACRRCEGRGQPLDLAAEPLGERHGRAFGRTKGGDSRGGLTAENELLRGLRMVDVLHRRLQAAVRPRREHDHAVTRLDVERTAACDDHLLEGRSAGGRRGRAQRRGEPVLPVGLFVHRPGSGQVAGDASAGVADLDHEMARRLVGHEPGLLPAAGDSRADAAVVAGPGADEIAERRRVRGRQGA
jgi:hypothetical protein